MTILQSIKMHDADWIFKGTTSLPRYDGRIYTVIPASSVFLGMLDPKRLVEKHYFDRDFMDYLLNYLSETFDFKKELLWDVDTKLYPLNQNKREIIFDVASVDDRGLRHRGSLTNLPFPNSSVITQVRSLRNLDYSCSCGKGTSKGEICSMPFEYCSPWGVSDEEYSESFDEGDVPKFYGKVMCKHEVRGLMKDGRYAFFNEETFQLFLPEMINVLRDYPAEKEKLTQAEMDVALNPLIRRMDFNDVLEYFREVHVADTKIETIEERIIRKLGRPTISHF